MAIRFSWSNWRGSSPSTKPVPIRSPRCSRGACGRCREGGRRFLETLAICGRPMAPELVYEASGLAGDERPLVALLRVRALPAQQRFRRAGRDLSRPDPRNARGAGVSGRRAPDPRPHGTDAGRQRRDDPEALYEHYRGAGDRERASTQAALAARKAEAALAFDRAALFYRGALELAPDSPARFEWREGLADALANAGRPAEAGDVYLEAASGRRPDTASRAPAARRGANADRRSYRPRSGGHSRGAARGGHTSPNRPPYGARVVPGAARAAPLAGVGVRGARSRSDRSSRPAPHRHLLVRRDRSHCWWITSAPRISTRATCSSPSTPANRTASPAAWRRKSGFSAIAGGPGVQRTAALVERARTMAERVGHPHAHRTVHARGGNGSVSGGAVEQGHPACASARWASCAISAWASPGN